MIIKASITINAAIPESPRVSSNATKFFVTCEPKNATSGPNNISAKTETPIYEAVMSSQTHFSRNLYRFVWECMHLVNYSQNVLKSFEKCKNFIHFKFFMTFSDFGLQYGFQKNLFFETHPPPPSFLLQLSFFYLQAF